MNSRYFIRDYSLSKIFNCNLYSVSMQKETKYDQMNLYVNFNISNFVDNIILIWGYNIKFNQIILNYYWITTDSWIKEY